MPRHVESKRNIYQRGQLQTREENIQLVSIACLMFAGIVGAAIGLMYLGHKSHEFKEKNWDSALATIKDVRTQLVGQEDAKAGGSLYEVHVLAAFSANGSPQERWIAVDQRPQSLDSAKFEGRVWKGKQFLVRWKPSDPNLIVVDLH